MKSIIDPRPSFVYLLHLDAPLSDRHTARHYLGFCYHIPSRMAKHSAGTGARFMQVAKERGIGFQIARIWPGDRSFERQLKNQKNAPKLCPICRRAHPNQLMMDLEGDLL
jgi:hypothetical protein